MVEPSEVLVEFPANFRCWHCGEDNVVLVSFKKLRQCKACGRPLVVPDLRSMPLYRMAHDSSCED